MCESGPPTGPIENGTTYIVRPRMLPSNSGVIVARISAGATQLFVGPASSSRSDAMKVRPSVRATSLGCERARYEPGRHSGLSLMILPSSTISRRSASFSARDPSTQWMRSGWVSAAISSTQATSALMPSPSTAGRRPNSAMADAGRGAVRGAGRVKMSARAMVTPLRSGQIGVLPPLCEAIRGVIGSSSTQEIAILSLASRNAAHVARTVHARPPHPPPAGLAAASRSTSSASGSASRAASSASSRTASASRSSRCCRRSRPRPASR